VKQYNFFSEDNRLERLSKMGDPLEKLSKTIDFEQFRPIIEATGSKKNKDPKKGGRPPFDAILMWKMVLLQEWYGISNDAVEYQVNDRLSFQRFLGLGLDDKVPDANTLWDFKEMLAKNDTDKKLFLFFVEQLEELEIITRKGSIVDATFAHAPKQRNSRDDNKKIKEGDIPEDWLPGEDDDDETKAKKANKLAQKDTDARWTKKGNETHFGYKDHVKVDTDSKMIVSFEVTPASTHDSQTFVALLDEKDDVVNADSAYVGEELEASIRAKLDDPETGRKITLNINEKGYRNKPLTEEQKASNREKNRTRARVEHVFGIMHVSMGEFVIRTIGMVRAKATVARRNMAYNMKRFVFLANKPKTA
jgi:IS5 family transposase